MLSELSHRRRSLSPDFHLPRFGHNDGEVGADDEELDHDVNYNDVPCRHVDSLIRQSRARSMVNL